ncbi:MAG: glycosyltransferase [Ignavibacteria bacterium]|jgi:cellulose synthase/poly-beta-1,6-N-acetylglucosamine synthase-like glycosyltransferase|nr:glycosyltransferase [Ignavibacteria bacterium]HRI31122.1 glycosyltransferase [Candidatus Kapabacteria bacterium]
MSYLVYIATAIIYAIRITIFTIGLRIERKRTVRTFHYTVYPSVSIVVPARNEESTLRECIESLIQCDYPKDNLEIIIVNDRSTDKTAEMAHSLASTYSHVKVLHLTEERSGNLRGKPGAIHHAINVAKGDIILMTDADCIVPVGWMQMMVQQFKDISIGLVASFTTIKTGSVFAQMQCVEWVLNHTMASAGIGLKQPLGCFGNNLAIRKKAYNDIGGYEGIPFSVTEDLALLQTIIRRGWEVRYIGDAQSTVETLPCTTFGEYVQQHHRWLRGGTALGWRAAVFVFFSASMWISFLAAIISQNWLMLPLILGIRLIGDLMVLTPSLYAIKRKDLFPWALLAVFFITALELVIPFSLLKKEVVWKGQLFR